MAKEKQRSRAGQNLGMGASSTSYLLDPLLLPRLHEYSQHNPLSTLDSAVHFLRTNFKEYQRKQLKPFRKLVFNAINLVKHQQQQQQSGFDSSPVAENGVGVSMAGHHRKPEIPMADKKLLMLEEDHVRRRRAKRGRYSKISASVTDEASTDGSDGGFGECEFDGDKTDDLLQRNSAKGSESSSRNRAFSETDSSEDERYLAEEAERPSFNLLNSSLRKTYKGRPALIRENSPSSISALDQRFGVPPLTSNPKEANRDRQPAMASEPGEAHTDSQAAFAPQNQIEAAAKANFRAGRKLYKTKRFMEDPKEQSLSDKSPAGRFLLPQAMGGSEHPIYPSASSPPNKAPSILEELRNDEIVRGLVIDDGETRETLARTIGPWTDKTGIRESDQDLGKRSRDDDQSIGGERSRDRELSRSDQHLHKGGERSRDGELSRSDQHLGKRLRDDDQGIGGEISRDHERYRSTKLGRCVVRKEKHILGSETGETFLSSLIVAPEKVKFKDLGGIQETVAQILEVIYPLYHPRVYAWLGLEPMRGLLLHGPPGCGKTKLANAIAFETNLPFLKISAPEVVSGMSGESESKIRSLFQEALRLAPSIIFIDEIDVISSKRESAQREMERRLVTQLMTCMDEISHSLPEEDKGGPRSGTQKGHVLVIGATNRPEALDPALRRPGRFDREIELRIPNEDARVQILTVLTRTLRLEGSFDFGEIARCTPGFVGADLSALTKEAASVAIKRILAIRGQDSSSLEEDDPWWERQWTDAELKLLSITMADFKEAVTKVQPSTKREGFSSVPNITWEDVGSLDCIRKELEFFIVRRIKYPKDYEALQLDVDSGFLLYGPPGCGKTLVAKAVANAAGANFIYIKGPELLNKYVGESERAVRQLFSRARTCSPCVLFFDEMDAMAPRRGSDGNAAAERVVNQLLIEMDGLEQRKGIFLLAATNRPDMIDPAMLRPGRLGKLLYVPLPDPQGRVSILRALTRGKPLDSSTDLESVGWDERCDGFSGADLAALVNEACVAAIRERSLGIEAATDSTQSSLVISYHHFEDAFTKVNPSVASNEVLHYEEIPRRLSRTQVHKKRRLQKDEGHLPLEKQQLSRTECYAYEVSNSENGT